MLDARCEFTPFSEENLSLWTGEGLLGGPLDSFREMVTACHGFLLCVQKLVEKHDLDSVRAKGVYCDLTCLE